MALMDRLTFLNISFNENYRYYPSVLGAYGGLYVCSEDVRVC